MASIQDVADAAYRIQQSSEEVQQRTQICADLLRTHSAQLAQSVRGSRTGEEAVAQVNQAEREVRDCAAALLTLSSTIDDFIKDLTK